MSLSSLQLDAFLEVARSGGFSVAAKRLFITQSALSQRILNLEEELGSTLLIRDPAGIRLTHLGEQILRYCQMREALEGEITGALHQKKSKALSGIVRVAGFSTVMRSVVIPSLRGLLGAHPDVQGEFTTAELAELPSLLDSARADSILLTHPLEKSGIENHLLGHEENVLVQPRGRKVRENTFLDHDLHDTTTSEFFRIQKNPPEKYLRSFFDEIYALMDGVRSGLGRAVIPLHLARSEPELEIVKGYRALKVPVYLCYHRQSYYTRLQTEVRQGLIHSAPALLKAAQN